MTEESGGRTGLESPAREYSGDDPDMLRAQVERTRAQLGDTVEELAARADVRAIARRKAAGVRERAEHVRSAARDRVTRAGAVPLVVTGAVVTLGAAAGVMAHRHRHGGR